MAESLRAELMAVKPVLRGWSHAIAFFGSVVAGVLLLRRIPAGPALGLTAVYSASLSALLGTSGLYHRVKWSPRMRTWMRRLDHGAIFVLIGGTSTPFALSLPPDARVTYLSVVWVACVIGLVQSVVWPYAPKWLVAATCVLVGWADAIFLPRMAHTFPDGVMPLIIFGGVAYSVGAGCYALKRPNPWPGVFGYHEVFHALVLLAAALHYIAVGRVVAV